MKVSGKYQPIGVSAAAWIASGLVEGALGGIRTHTVRVLSPFPLPVGIRGPGFALGVRDRPP
jgi:hypothetical protein